MRDHATGNCIPGVVLENSRVTHGWLVTSFRASLSVDNSELVRLASHGCLGCDPLPTDVTSALNSEIEELHFMHSSAKFIFDKSTIQVLTALVPSNSTIEGNITFSPDAYVSCWFDTIIRRIYPVLLVDGNGNPISNASLYLYDKDGNPVWTGMTDNEGRASFEIEFNDDNYTGLWELTIEYEDKVIRRQVKLLSSTPIGLGYPQPDIKANGSDGPITISQGTNLAVAVALDPGSYDGEDADWWVAATSPFGLYWCTLDWGWVRSDPPIRIYGGPLFDLSSYEVLNTSGLPMGMYTLYFGVDLLMNKSFDLDQLYYDSVDVTIE